MQRKILLLKFIGLFICVSFNYNSYATDYYWVGGTGNWSDYSHHWATSSGGNTFQTQTPQSVDNVYFDNNSFSAPNQTVTCDQNIIYCDTMKWSNTNQDAIFKSISSNNLQIFGSLIFNSHITNQFAGNIEFRTSGNQSITTSAVPFAGSVTFNSVGGTGVWTMTDHFDATGNTISINSGSVFTNGVLVNAATFSANAGTTLSLGSSTIVLSKTLGSETWYLATTTNFNCGTSNIILTNPNTATLGATFNGGNQTYYQVTCKGFPNTLINGNNTILDTLKLLPGTITKFSSGTTQTFGTNGTIVSEGGDCKNYCFIQSSVTGIQVNFKKDMGSDITISGAIIQDNNAISAGGVLFKAVNSSVGTSNITGQWNITASGKQFFWIGGNGNWSDPSHWSVNGGGSTGCIPGPLDMAIFNDASGNGIVTIDLSPAVCKNIDWSNRTIPGLSLTGISTKILYVYGSMIFSSAMGYSFAGTIEFRSNVVGNTVTTAGKVFLNTTTFDGVDGGWTMQDNFDATDQYIYLNNGFLNTNGVYVKAYNFITNGGAVFGGTSLTLGASIIELNNSSFIGNATWQCYPGTLNCGTSTILMKSTGLAPFLPANFVGGGNTYYKVEINALPYTNISDNNIFKDSLKLDHGTTTKLASGSIQTFTNTGTLYAQGTCAQNVFLKSSIPGSTATIQKAAGSPIVIDFVTLQDNTADNQGGMVSFSAKNSSNGGNVAGWNIIPVSGKEFVWQGGTGNWSDPTHWKVDGDINNPSQCIPSYLDSVFFNATSGSGTVTVDVANASCKDMTWSGTNGMELTGGPTRNLNIYGSLILENNLNYTFAGDINFLATSSGKTITTSGKKMLRNVKFDGIGGGWILQDSLDCSNCQAFELINGNLNTNNKKVKAVVFNTYSGGSLTLGSSLIVMNQNSGFSSWSMDPSASLNAGTSTISIDGDANGSTACIFAGGNKSYYNLGVYYKSGFGTIVSGNNTFSGTMYFDTATTTFFTAASVQTLSNSGKLHAIGKPGGKIEFKSTIQGIAATLRKPTGIDVCTNYLVLNDNHADGQGVVKFYTGRGTDTVTNWDGWTYGSSVFCDVTLPIELVLFRAYSLNSEVVLHWSTSGLNDGGFEIEKSIDGKHFNKIGTILSNNNSFTNNKYVFTDKSPEVGVNYYRLKQLNKNGEYIYSKIISVYYSSAKISVSVSPKAVNNDINVIVNLNENTKSQLDIEVYDVLGKKVKYVNNLSLNGGSNVYKVNVSDLTKGTYFIIVNKENIKLREKFLKY